MGIEGERLVLDYLSKVGDLAHTTSMTAVERRQLVVQLREEIGRHRSAVEGEESGADVQRILRRIGRPEDVVAARAAEAPATAARPAPAPAEEAPVGPVPAEPQRADAQRADAQRGAPVPGPRLAPEDLIDESVPDPPAAGGRRAAEDWPDGPIGGFTGGILEPDMLRPPDRQAPRPEVPLQKQPRSRAPAGPDADTGEDGEAGAAGDAGEGPAGTGKTPRRRRLLRRALGGRHVGGPVELLAGLLLIAGGVVASLYTMLAGWLLGYWSPRLSRKGAKWAVFGMPALVLGCYLGWLFGRVNGYWGEQIEGAVLREALVDNYPVLLRLAAVASGLFLLWRALRRPAAAKE